MTVLSKKLLQEIEAMRQELRNLEAANKRLKEENHNLKITISGLEEELEVWRAYE